MEEESIRPEELMNIRDELLEKDVDQLLAKNEFDDVFCPVCESMDYKQDFEVRKFRFFTCKDCETMFITPRPNPDTLSNYYATSESSIYWNNVILPATEKERRTQIFVPRAKLFAELCKQQNMSNSVLYDIGAGDGTFCEEVKKMALFKKIVGIELSDSLSESYKAKGIDLIISPIEKVNLPPVDVITAFEVIEHVYSPKDFLFACARLLNDNGLFVFTTPNIKGFDLAVLRELSSNIRGPSHLNYFHPESISRLLENTGFKVINIFTPGELDVGIVRKRLMEGHLDHLKCSCLKYLLIDQWETNRKTLQQFLRDNNMSSHMWVVARKN